MARNDRPPLKPTPVGAPRHPRPKRQAAFRYGISAESRVAAAAEAWLAAHPDDALSDMRFDIVLVVPGNVPRHLPAAFEASRWRIAGSGARGQATLNVWKKRST